MSLRMLVQRNYVRLTALHIDATVLICDPLYESMHCNKSWKRHLLIVSLSHWLQDNTPARQHKLDLCVSGSLGCIDFISGAANHH